MQEPVVLKPDLKVVGLTVALRFAIGLLAAAGIWFFTSSTFAVIAIVAITILLSVTPFFGPVSTARLRTDGTAIEVYGTEPTGRVILTKLSFVGVEEETTKKYGFLKLTKAFVVLTDDDGGWVRLPIELWAGKPARIWAQGVLDAAWSTKPNMTEKVSSALDRLAEGWTPGPGAPAPR